MSSVPKQVSNTLQSLVTLTEAGIIRLQRPDRALRTALTIIRWGVTPAAGYEASAARYPDEVALIDELGSADVPGDPGADELARPRDGRRRRQRGRQRRDHGPQPPRVRGGGRGVLEARGARAVPQHVVLRPAAGRRGRAREAEGDHLRRGVRRGPGRRRPPPQALHLVGGARGGDQGPDARGADRARRPGERRAAPGAGQGDHPHLRHHRHAQGRLAQPAEVAGSRWRRCSRASRSRRARRR